MTETLIVQSNDVIPVPATAAKQKRVKVTASDPQGGAVVLGYANHPVFDLNDAGVGTLEQGQAVTISERNWFRQPSDQDSCAVIIEDV
jgi:hypothetical protein